MTKETAHEVWTNAPESFDSSDRNALADRWPEGFIVVTVAQGRTPSTVDSPPEGYQDITGAVFHGVESDAAEEFTAEMRSGEWLREELGRVASGNFEAVVVVRWAAPPPAHRVVRGELAAAEGGWDFDLWRENGEVVYHAFADDEGPHVCTGCIGDGPCELEVGRFGSQPDCLSCGATPEEPHASECSEVEAHDEADAEAAADSRSW